MAIGIFVSGAAFALLFGLLYTSESYLDQSGDNPFGGAPTGDATQIANSVYTAGLSVGYLLMLVIGVIQIGAEYRHRTITSTFLTQPRRPRVMLGKVLALVLVAAAYGLLSLIGSVLVGAITLHARGAEAFPSAQVFRTLVLSLLVLGLWALIGLGAGILIPNQVAALLIARRCRLDRRADRRAGDQAVGLREGPHRAVPPERGEPGGHQHRPGLGRRRPAVVVGRSDRAGGVGRGVRRRRHRAGGPPGHQLTTGRRRRQPG